MKEVKRQDGKEASVADAINGKEHPHAIPKEIMRGKDIKYAIRTTAMSLGCIWL